MKGDLHLYYEARLPSPSVYVDWLKSNLDNRQLIPYVLDGLYFDFHALRHQAGTLLAASGVHPKVAQSIMRHSDINLTMSLYTHTLHGQESQAVEKSHGQG